ncbi:MAG: isocitrate/isopropylmalate dehydrogenase family protein [Elusimicrobia bacterium]|nr:isocitrate/isopropylmalate dehydrogenase family protein [Elusimicrobiota bacterium]
MPKYKIAVLPGDGVGKDVMDGAMIVLEALRLDAEYKHGDIGWEFWKKEGNALPERTVKLLQETDVCLFGAITSKPSEEAAAELDPVLQGKGLKYFSPIVQLRQLFDLYCNMRPCKAYPGNPLNWKDTIDWVVFRENTEGLYVGVEYHPVPQELTQCLAKYSAKAKRFAALSPDEMAMSLRVITKKGAERIIRAAFEFARKNKRKSVTLAEKPNVLRETSGLMTRIGRKVAADYPEIPFQEANIDAMCMWLLKNPENYDVIVTSNMFGDIISDLCAQLVGGLGFASSGNIGEKYAVFEPTHGSAPKYAGQYKVNPMAMILTVKLMLEWLGEGKSAVRLERAVAEVINGGKVRTYDMGGKNTSLEIAEAVAKGLNVECGI